MTKNREEISRRASLALTMNARPSIPTEHKMSRYQEQLFGQLERGEELDLSRIDEVLSTGSSAWNEQLCKLVAMAAAQDGEVDVLFVHIDREGELDVSEITSGMPYSEL